MCGSLWRCQHISTPLFKFPFLFTVLFPSHAPQDQLDPRMELPHGWTSGRAPPGYSVPNQALMDTRAPLGRMPTGPRSLVPPRQLPSPSLPPTPDEAPSLRRCWGPSRSASQWLQSHLENVFELHVELSFFWQTLETDKNTHVKTFLGQNL